MVSSSRRNMESWFGCWPLGMIFCSQWIHHVLDESRLPLAPNGSKRSCTHSHTHLETNVSWSNVYTSKILPTFSFDGFLVQSCSSVLASWPGLIIHIGTWRRHTHITHTHTHTFTLAYTRCASDTLIVEDKIWPVLWRAAIFELSKDLKSVGSNKLS